MCVCIIYFHHIRYTLRHIRYVVDYKVTVLKYLIRAGYQVHRQSNTMERISDKTALRNRPGDGSDDVQQHLSSHVNKAKPAINPLAAGAACIQVFIFY